MHRLHLRVEKVKSNSQPGLEPAKGAATMRESKAIYLKSHRKFSNAWGLWFFSLEMVSGQVIVDSATGWYAEAKHEVVKKYGRKNIAIFALKN